VQACSTSGHSAPTFPFVEELRQELVAARQLEKGRAESTVLRARAAAARAQAHQKAAVAQAGARIERAERALDEARAHARRTLSQLDQMAGLHAPQWPASPNRAPTTNPVSAPPDPLSPSTSPDPHPESATRWTGNTSGRPVEAVPGANETLPEPAWMGPDNGKSPPPVPRWLSYPLLVLLACVEFPIYFEVFRTFHPRNEAQRYLFTTAVTLAMVVGPHVAGVFVRHRHERPVERVTPVAATAILSAWAAAAVCFGYLRQHFLMNQDVSTATTHPSTRSQLLSLSPVTVTVVFTLTLIISGLIAFLLGTGHEHPGQKAYRYARRRVSRAERAHARAIRRQRRHQETEWRSTAVDEAHLRAPFEHRQRALLAEFHAAEAAYLDAVAKELANPTATVAIGTYLDERANRHKGNHGRAGPRLAPVSDHRPD
jgi:hypothetical protein